MKSKQVNLFLMNILFQIILYLIGFSIFFFQVSLCLQLGLGVGEPTPFNSKR